MNAALKIDDACFIISLLVALRQIGGFNPKESPRKGGGIMRIITIIIRVVLITGAILWFTAKTAA